MANIIKRAAGNPVSPAAPRSLNGFLETFFPANMTRLFGDDFWGADAPAVSAATPVNIRETATGYALEVVAPGLKKEDFRVSVDNNMLTVAFEHKEEQKQEGEGGKILRHEYRRQSFSRSFGLDEKVDATGINARYADGILHLWVPKKPEAQQLTRSIEVQ